MIDTFGFSHYKVMLSTKPEKAAGSPESWELATGILRNALTRQAIEFQVDPGEGVFYGPKIDIKFEDAIGRLWQGPTIQVDFSNPARFHVNYVGEDGQEHEVAMVHRTVLGSMERFMASLVEHYGGAFPVWLAPVQVAIIPVADRHIEYASKLEAELKNDNVRVKLDGRTERMNLKIRQAQLEKIPYMLIVGDKEVAGNTVSVRLRSGEQQAVETFADFKAKVLAVIANKAKEFGL